MKFDLWNQVSQSKRLYIIVIIVIKAELILSALNYKEYDLRFSS